MILMLPSFRGLLGTIGPLCSRKYTFVDREWVELARKQLKGENPEVKLKWNTLEVIET